MWIVMLAGATGRMRILALSTFAAFLAGWLITIVAEIRCRLALHRPVAEKKTAT